MPIIKDKLKDYQKHVNKARSNYISKIYKSYDSYINNTYKIDVNQKKIDETLIKLDGTKQKKD